MAMTSLTQYPDLSPVARPGFTDDSPVRLKRGASGGIRWR